MVTTEHTTSDTSEDATSDDGNDTTEDPGVLCQVQFQMHIKIHNTQKMEKISCICPNFIIIMIFILTIYKNAY